MWKLLNWFCDAVFTFGFFMVVVIAALGRY
jgi:hypothetical protein